MVEGTTLGERLDAWETSERRERFRTTLAGRGFDPDDVIFDPDRAATAGMRGTVAFPTGNLAPHGSVVKATAIDRSMLDPGGVYELTGPARVFITEHEAIEAIKDGTVQAGEVIALIGCGPGGHRDGGDVPADLRAQARAVRPPGRADSPMLGSPGSRPAPVSGTSDRRRWPAGRSVGCGPVTSFGSGSTRRG